MNRLKTWWKNLVYRYRVIRAMWPILLDIGQFAPYDGTCEICGSPIHKDHFVVRRIGVYDGIEYLWPMHPSVCDGCGNVIGWIKRRDLGQMEVTGEFQSLRKS